MKFFAAFPALCVSHAFTFPNLPSTLQKPKFLKLIKRRILLLSGRSEAGVYPCWHLGQAHQTLFKAYACGYLVITLPSIDCPAGMSALTLGLMSSGIAEVEAEQAFVLVSATPGVSPKSWDKHLSASKYHSCQSHAKTGRGRADFSTGKLPWASLLYRTIV